MSEQNKTFVYSADMLDSDASNARSAGYRVLRDKAGLPHDDEDKMTGAAKKIHAACGMAARNAANVVFKGMTAKKPRLDWTPEQAEKVHGLMAAEGIKAYRLTLTAQGFKTPDNVEAEALVAFKARLVERRALAEVTFKTGTAMNLDAAASDIFK